MDRNVRAGLACVAAVCACFGGSPEPPASEDPTTIPGPPLTLGDWTYYGTGQGLLSGDVRDVSADEAGNVYVAGGDAVYAKAGADERFLRFDAANAGLTESCRDPPDGGLEIPAEPYRLCPVISVAGAAPGRAIVGLEGLGVEWDSGPLWVQMSGGADVVAFDPGSRTLARTRHVMVASPPHVVCKASGEDYATACDPTDWWWNNGRRLFRQTHRMAVNHDRTSGKYGDAWMGGNHGTFAVLFENAAARGWTDRTAGFGPEWAAAKDVWEHLHPSVALENGEYMLISEGWAISIDPRTGTPWGSNGVRTAYLSGYGADLSGRPSFWMGPWSAASQYIDLWPDSGDAWAGPTNDRVRSMSHCQDGTLWIGSLTNGLARIDPAGVISHVHLPDPGAWGDGVSAVACDPADGSVWIGLERGGLMRLRGGSFEIVDPAGLSAFATHRVEAIQVDRWSTPRTVYVAFGARRDELGRIAEGGGIAAFDGP